MSITESAPAYEPILLETLRIDTVLSFDLYLYLRQRDDYILFRSYNLPFKEEHRRRLIENKIAELFIDTSDRKKYLNYVEQNLDQIVTDEHIETEKKAAIVYSSAVNIVQEVLEKPESSENIKRSKNLVNHTISYIFQGEEAFKQLLSITSYDYYTYTHSVNVCAMGIMLATRMGFTSLPELQDFGTGALLHDVGKSHIQSSILLKKDPLSPDEWKIMKLHPEMGIEIVHTAEGISDASRTVIMQHHEKVDGGGYPFGLKGHQIHPYSKIGCVVDIFDALTTKRCYKDAVNSYPALKIMKSYMAKQIDKEIFREFVLLLKK